MKAFLAAIIAILVITIGAEFAFQTFDRSAATVYQAPDSVRLD